MAQMWQHDKAVTRQPKINGLVGVFGWLKSSFFCWLYSGQFTHPTTFCFVSKLGMCYLPQILSENLFQL